MLDNGFMFIKLSGVDGVTSEIIKNLSDIVKRSM